MIDNPTFHPLIYEWFSHAFGKPSDIQNRSWPSISSGKHTLLTAPTGSGKTLAAFLWALNQLITGAWPREGTAVLYISPLKALNNDIRRNLLGPLSELESLFKSKNVPFPPIRVLTRSGDTPPTERQQMLRNPPNILITTPESLNILLTSVNSRRNLRSLATVILDEIHAVADTKRGSLLITNVERLTLLSGEFQRVALSATVRPVDRIVDFLAGYSRAGDSYHKRDVEIVQSNFRKKTEIRVYFPKRGVPEPIENETASATGRPDIDNRWLPLIAEFKRIIRSNRTTLFFTNSRRLSEKLTRLINENEESLLAYSHHGSLSRELRSVVEKKLKEGKLSSVVATNSLELGIDIGSLDEVILVQTPPSIASGLQRTGRSGHGVRETSRACIFPLHGRDILDAAVMADAVCGQDIEEMHPIVCPLDVLAQIIVSMVAVEDWNIDELFAFLKTAYPFHNLQRRHLGLVLDMLTGRYAETRIRELSSRISIDRLENMIRAKGASRYLVYMSGGTIPDRGYYTLIAHDSKAKIGELDEEFVWERAPGDTFSFGIQSWRIQKIGSKEVEVLPTKNRSVLAPFWKGEAFNRDFYFAEKIGRFLEQWNASLETSAFRQELETRYFLDPGAIESLVEFLVRQRQKTGVDLPHRHHLLIEHCRGEQTRDHNPRVPSDTHQVIVHTLWGGRINRPFSLALSQGWEEKFGYPLEVYADNDAIMINLAHDFSARDMVNLVQPHNLEGLLRRRLEKTGFFGARFRECASTSLLLPRKGFNQRVPLWLNRLRAKKLLSAVMRLEDFPILIETWRTCLQDEFDLPHMLLLMDEIQRGLIRIEEVETSSPSPFSANLIWWQTNRYIYEDDTPQTGNISNLSRDLIRDIALSTRLRPSIPSALIEELTSKLQRTAPGYSPSSSQDLLDWVKERLMIPVTEWEHLLDRILSDHQLSREQLVEPIGSKLVLIRAPNASLPSIAALEDLSRLIFALSTAAKVPALFSPLNHETPISYEDLKPTRFSSPSSRGAATAHDQLMLIIGEWLRFYGPLPLEKLSEVFGLQDSQIPELLESLQQTGSVVIDRLSANARETEICDLENLERLLRLVRIEARPVFQSLGPEHLPLFLATWQGLVQRGDGEESLKSGMEKLFGYPLPAECWEKDIFPMRIRAYNPAWLDTLISKSDLTWIGSGRKRIFFSFESDIHLYRSGKGKREAGLKTNPLGVLFPDDRGRYDFWTLLDHSGLSSRELTGKLWNLTWAGMIANDTFSVLRRGIETRFQAAAMLPGRHSLPGSRSLSLGRERVGHGKWESSRPLHGNWLVLPRPLPHTDPLQKEDDTRERISLLLDRYGILFKEILSYELPHFKWAELFYTLRLMELSGEILTGRFFEGIPGIQFIAHSALNLLSGGLSEEPVFWMSALDPASLCGIKINGLKEKLPRRAQGIHLVYHGTRLVLVSMRLGKDLEIRVEPETPEIPLYLDFFRAALSRSFQPLKAVRTYTINGENAVKSPYRGAMIKAGFRDDFNALILRAPYV